MANGLPADFNGARLTPIDDVTLVEVACRLVGKRSEDRKTVVNLSLLVYPSIDVKLDSIDAALQQHMPAVAVKGGVQPGGSGQHQQQQQQQHADAQVSGWPQLAMQLLASGAKAVLSRVPGPWQALSHELPPPQLLAWHTRLPLLAVGHSASGLVLLYDTSAAAAAGNGSLPGAVSQPCNVLKHQLQQQVSSLAWRPVHASMLAVGCCGGVALWSLGKLPLAAASVHWGGGSDGSAAGQQAGWVTFLDFKPGCRVTCLSWSPDGTKLAGCSGDTNRLMVWDAALAVGLKLRLGLAPVHLLAWSPDGNYLFAADRAGAFYLYETVSWSLKRWEAPLGAAVTGATWAPDASVLLLSLAGSSLLVGLHIVGSPAHLTEQMLPVALPGISDAELPKARPVAAAAGAAVGGSTGCIRSIAWDPSGNRLAVVLGAPHPAAGTVALYSTAFVPVVTCNLIGYVQPGGTRASAAAAGDGTDAAGPQHALQVAFAPAAAKDKAAGVLSVGVPAGGAAGSVVRVQNVPMYF